MKVLAENLHTDETKKRRCALLKAERSKTRADYDLDHIDLIDPILLINHILEPIAPTDIIAPADRIYPIYPIDPVVSKVSTDHIDYIDLIDIYRCYRSYNSCIFPCGIPGMVQRALRHRSLNLPAYSCSDTE